MIEYHGTWDDIIDVSSYFLNYHEFNRYYIRELPVRTHTKFIESNKNLFTSLLDFLMPPEKFLAEYSGARNFEKRLNSLKNYYIPYLNYYF